MSTVNGRVTLAAITFFLFISAHAEIDNIKEGTDEDFTRLIQLVESTDFHAAYLLGLDLQTEWEWDGEFDFNFGFAAAQTGHYNHAIFSFERTFRQLSLTTSDSV